jgi:acyl-CoA-binding protein
MYSLFKQASCGDCDKGKYLYIWEAIYMYLLMMYPKMGFGT